MRRAEVYRDVFPKTRCAKLRNPAELKYIDGHIDLAQTIVATKIDARLLTAPEQLEPDLRVRRRIIECQPISRPIVKVVISSRVQILHPATEAIAEERRYSEPLRLSDRLLPRGLHVEIVGPSRQRQAEAQSGQEESLEDGSMRDFHGMGSSWLGVGSIRRSSCTGNRDLSPPPSRNWEVKSVANPVAERLRS